ncbi:MAG: VWA domain-containing protein [Gammaproteobacteria bacterium]|nr:VWA domain-containing protein [Gammaproteobacteria bacterium]
MARRKRKATVFSLSFLDIMSCGFGAVVLFFMIINHATKETNAQVNVKLISEVNLMDKRVELSKRNLFELRTTIDSVTRRQSEIAGQIQQIVQVLEDKKTELARLDQSTLAEREAIEKLKADIKSLEEATRRLQGSQQEQDDVGDDLQRIIGAGDRLYLTGLKLGGKRVLFLVDSSASMLDETIVNIIRRRNMSEQEQRNSVKWRRAVGSVRWLIAKLPKEIGFQIYTFNQTARPVVDGTAGDWLDAADPEQVTAALQGLDEVVPSKGTSLSRALQVSRDMSPPPDNIYLLVDGLPTMGDKLPIRKTASPKARVQHFESALRNLAGGIPVNIILFPMEGDARAAPMYWRLAQLTDGSFISPARDWP